METYTLAYDPADEQRWRERDPGIVPAKLLDHKGNGVAGSFHFGEYILARHLQGDGWVVFAENYDVISKRPRKYAANNELIRSLVGAERFDTLRRAIQSYRDAGSIWQTDILAIRGSGLLFAEVKKGHDRLRPGQIAFMTLVESLGHRTALYHLVPEPFS